MEVKYMNFFVKDNASNLYRGQKWNLPIRSNIKPGDRIHINSGLYRIDRINYSKCGKEIYLSKMYV